MNKLLPSAPLRERFMTPEPEWDQCSLSGLVMSVVESIETGRVQRRSPRRPFDGCRAEPRYRSGTGENRSLSEVEMTYYTAGPSTDVKILRQLPSNVAAFSYSKPRSTCNIIIV